MHEQGDYQQRLQDDLNSYAERSIVIQAQLGHALNISDWLLASSYLEELGSLQKAIALTFREAAKRRDRDTEPLEKVMIAVIYSDDEFYNDRLLDKIERIKKINGSVTLFVKRGAFVPRGFLGSVNATIFYFDDTPHLNMLVSCFLSTQHWKVGHGDFVKVYGHGARHLKKNFAHDQDVII